MRLLLVQYAGDYLAAHEQLQQSGTENYYGHSHVLDTLGKLVPVCDEVGILCGTAPRSYDVKLPSGLRVMAANADPYREPEKITRILEAFAPTHLLVLGPLTRILKWGLSRNVRMAGLFADSFEIGRLRYYYRFGFLASTLIDHRVEWVANHGLNACRSLAKLGVSPNKIIPWDWPHKRSPENSPIKTLSDAKLSLFYAGAITKGKGIGDAIGAIAHLKRRGMKAELSIAGKGELGTFSDMARSLDVADRVHFLGVIPNERVLELMREASIVIVPSRHAYPEGLPLTIYEALCARTPIVASDHPMFEGHLVHRETAMIFPAGDAGALATRIEDLAKSPALYSSISEAAEGAWRNMQIPVKWGEFVSRWVRNDPTDREWMREHCLGSGLYGRT